MYFAHGWPKVYATDLEPSESIIHVHSDHQYIILVTQSTVQVWSSGQHRVKLGSCARIASELEDEGRNIHAFWSTPRNGLAVVTSKNFLHFYAVHTWKDPVLSLGKANDIGLKKLDIYLRHSVAIDSCVNARCITGDARNLILGMDDGSLLSYSWLGKSRTRCDALWLAQESLQQQQQDNAEEQQQAPQNGTSEDPHTPRSQMYAPQAAVVHIHHAESVSTMVLVFSDGSAALFKMPESGLHQLELLELSSWLCPPSRQAICAQIGASAQMVAVGCTSGEVMLYRLYPTCLAYSQPWTSDPPVDDPYNMLVRVLSLHDWGHRTHETGAAGQVQWSPDCRAVAVGYAAQGMVVWSPSGCRLACSLRQTPSLKAAVYRSQSLAPAFQDLAEMAAAVAEGQHVPVEGGVTALGWGQCGYQLVLAETGGSRVLVELQFAKTLPNNHRVAHGRGQVSRRPGARDAEVHVLQAHDRILMISDASDPQRERRSAFREDTGDVDSSSDLAVQHVLVPAAYLGANWPILHAAVSANGANVAVAGQRGLAVYSRPSERWRLFGDVSQERTISCQALCWLDSIIVVVSALNPDDKNAAPGACELLLFPRYHLDFSSLLARYPLPTRPVAIDCISNFILVASEPLELAVLQVELKGELSPSTSSQASITLVRELSIMNAGLPLLDIALVPPPSDNTPDNGTSKSPPLPKHCVLLRWGGLMSVLDMELGSELPLSADVESFWLSDSHPHQLALPPPFHRRHSSFDHRYGDTKNEGGRMGYTDTTIEPSTSLEDDVEMPWWAYGAKGMQLWFPSSLSQPLSPNLSPPGTTNSMDIELEFDREVYPIGISWSDAAIVGLTQRLVGGLAASPAHQSFPCFHLLPESQPVLPCLLRRLLQAGASNEALLLARRHQRGHHFLRSLEWLLFTALELDTSKRSGSAAKQRLQAPARRSINENFFSGGPVDQRRAGTQMVSPLLTASAELIRGFPEFADVVVSVARKTDASLWPTLFAAVGSPSVLLEGLLEAGALRSAACFLLVIDRLEGSALAQSLALRLLRASLKRAQYHLSAELLRFAIPPGEMDSLFGASDAARRTSSSELTNPKSPHSPSTATTPPSPTSTPPPPGASAFESADQSYSTWLLSLFQRSPGPTALQSAAAAAITASSATSPHPDLPPLPAASTASGPPSTAPPSTPTPPTLQTALSGGSQTRGFEAGAVAGRLDRGTSGGMTARGWSKGGVSRNSGSRRTTVEGLGDAPSMTPGIDACKVVADHGWHLLESGHLAALAQLASAMSFLPGGGLFVIMTFSWETSEQLPMLACPPSCASDLHAALAVTVQELPVWDNDRVQNDAELVLQVARQVGAIVWSVVVAVVLVEVDTILDFKTGYPEMWTDFCELVKGDPAFEFLNDVMDALTAAGPDTPSQPPPPLSPNRKEPVEGAAGAPALRQEGGEGAEGGRQEAVAAVPRLSLAEIEPVAE